MTTKSYKLLLHKSCSSFLNRNPVICFQNFSLDLICIFSYSKCQWTELQGHSQEILKNIRRKIAVGQTYDS